MIEKERVSLSEAIENVLGYDEMISLAREFTFDTYADNAGFDIDEIDDIFSGYSPSDLLLKFYYGDANPRHDVFCFDGYANLTSYETWNDWFDDMVDECDFKEWLIGNDHITEEDIEAEMHCD